MPEIRDHETPCCSPPDLAPLPASLRSRIRHDPAAGSLHLSGDLGSGEARALRDLSGEPGWQLVVDRLATLSGIAQASRASQYPSTMWGRLLVNLGSDEGEHWERFMRDYREPIRKSLQRLGGRREDPGALADGFFSWFFLKGIHRRLSRVDDEGCVHHFRGYLKLCLRWYMRDERGGSRPEASLFDEDKPARDELSKIVDLEYCRAGVACELEVMKRDHYSLWRSFLDDCRGDTLESVAIRLREETGSGSVSGAHRARSRAREFFRTRLVRYRLRHGAVTEEDALREFQELIPLIAQVLMDYVGQLQQGEG